MIVECIAIIFGIVCMVFVFLRAKKTSYALSIIPLMIVPALHIIAMYCSKLFANMFDLDRNLVMIAIDVLGLIASCLLLGLASGNFSSKKSRASYLLVTGAFLVILSWVLVANNLRF